MNEQPDYCDKCQSESNVKTIDSRASHNGRLRRYYCSKCHTRWSTNERKSSYSDMGKSISRKSLTGKITQLTALVKDIEKVACNIQ